MNEIYEDYLMHFNKNHDPRNGQFAKGNGIVSKAVSGIKNMSPGKQAAAAAGTMAAVSGLATVRNFKNAQNIMRATSGINILMLNKSQAARMGVVKAGKVALTAALAVIGGHMIADYMHDKKTQKTTAE